MAASAARRGQRALEPMVRNLHPSAVRIEIHPRPKNLAETREIMHVIQGYGELSMFKHLKYEPQAPAPNVALAIFHETQSAKKLLGASPLRFTLDLSRLSRGSSSGYSPSQVGYPAPQVEKEIPEEGDQVLNGKRSPDEPKQNVEERSVRESRWSCADENISGLTEKNDFGEEVLSLRSVKEKKLEEGSEDVDNILDLISKSAGWGKTFEESVRKKTPPSAIGGIVSDRLPADAKSSVPVPTFTPNSLPTPFSNTDTTSSSSTATSPNHPPWFPSRSPSAPHTNNLTNSSSSPTLIPSPREFYLAISPSILDHKEYISRQGYTSSFHPDFNSPMAADLERRVPLEGLADMDVRKGEVDLRIRNRRKEREEMLGREDGEGRGSRRRSLREMWEEGVRRAGKDISDVGGRIG